MADLTCLVASLALQLQNATGKIKELRKKVKAPITRHGDSPSLPHNRKRRGKHHTPMQLGLPPGNSIPATHRKPKGPATLFKPGYSKGNRELIVEITINIPAISYLTILITINKAFAPSKLL